MSELPEPGCYIGYPVDQVETILGATMPRFQRWMRGQTIALCDGLRWNPMAQTYDASNCGPHGAVIYARDLRRFLAGLPVID